MKKKLKTTVSLIITTYNRKEYIDLVLQFVSRLHYLPNEVLIADDGSTDGTKELIDTYKNKLCIPLIHIYQENLGFRLSKIRNKAIAAASCDYIIMIDGDMLVDPYFIKNHLNKAKKGLLLQGGRIWLKEAASNYLFNMNKTTGLDDRINEKFLKKISIKSRKYSILSYLVYKFSRLDASFFTKSDMIKSGQSCNMSFFKEDCMNINGFNEDFEGWGREDSDFVARFLFNGGEFRKLRFSAIAYHLHHKRYSQNYLEKNNRIYLNTIHNRITYCKNGIYK